jgi:hypothetical protein
MSSCKECHISLGENRANSLCSVCREMYEVLLAHPYFVQLHNEWADENARRIKAKDALLHPKD